MEKYKEEEEQEKSRGRRIILFYFSYSGSYILGKSRTPKVLPTHQILPL